MRGVCRLVGMPAKLAWSVHAADDILRSALVPTTRHPMVRAASTGPSRGCSGSMGRTA